MTHLNRDGTHDSAEPSPLLEDPSDLIEFEEVVAIFDEPRSTVAAKIQAMELALDRTTLRLTKPPSNTRERRQLVIVVPELGGLRMPGSTARYRRSWVEAYRNGGLPAAMQALSTVHAWLRNARGGGDTAGTKLRKS